MEASLRKKIIAAAGGGVIAIATVMLHQLEGVRYDPYYDVAGVLTVCYGHTGSDIIKSKRYTQAECDELLKKDLIPFHRAVEQSVKVPASEYQKAALTTFSYNVGVSAFEKSTLLKNLNAGKYHQACEGLKQWIYAGGQKWKGLMNRREVEAEVCMWSNKNA